MKKISIDRYNSRVDITDTNSNRIYVHRYIEILLFSLPITRHMTSRDICSIMSKHTLSGYFSDPSLRVLMTKTKQILGSDIILNKHGKGYMLNKDTVNIIIQ